MFHLRMRDAVSAHVRTSVVGGVRGTQPAPVIRRHTHIVLQYQRYFRFTSVTGELCWAPDRHPLTLHSTQTGQWPVILVNFRRLPYWLLFPMPTGASRHGRTGRSPPLTNNMGWQTPVRRSPKTHICTCTTETLNIKHRNPCIIDFVWDCVHQLQFYLQSVHEYSNTPPVFLTVISLLVAYAIS